MEIHEHLPVSLHLSNLELVEECTSTNYDKIQLYQHSELGKVLLLNDEIQVVEAWAPIYHETIVHLPIAFISNVERVLILGGGCFFAAKEVLKYSSIQEVTMIDIDSEVTEMMKRNFLHAKEVCNDIRFNLIINNAFEEIKSLKGHYDLIINDSIDLLGISSFNKSDVFRRLLKLTSSEGLCVDMIYRHIFERKSVQRTISNFREQKIKSVFSLLAIPEYPGVLHLIAIWTRSNENLQHLKHTSNAIQKGWIDNPNDNPCELFNPNCLDYYLYLPPYLKKLLDESADI